MFFYNYVEAFDVIKRAIDIMAENEIAFVAEKLNDSIKRLEGGDGGSEEKIVKLIRMYTQPALVLAVVNKEINNCNDILVMTNNLYKPIYLQMVDVIKCSVLKKV